MDANDIVRTILAHVVYLFAVIAKFA